MTSIIIDKPLNYPPGWVIYLNFFLKLAILGSLLWSISNFILVFYWLIKKDKRMVKKRISNTLLGALMVLVFYGLAYFFFSNFYKAPLRY